MKLYVNGDSHAAAAEAVNTHAFAEDDNRYFYMGRAPHPENAAVSWATTLARMVKAVLHNDSESASSNTRITRTTRAWLDTNHRWLPETVVMIGWSTWEREEWLIDDEYYQVNASGIDHVPADHRDRYRDYVSNIDWSARTRIQHESIWHLHEHLRNLQVRHVFFNGNNHFATIPSSQRHDWNGHYVHPYDPEYTYDQWLKSHGYQTVAPDSWHFGADAHAAWSRFMLQYGMDLGIWR